MLEKLHHTSPKVRKNNHYMDVFENGSEKLNRFLGTWDYPRIAIGHEESIYDWAEDTDKSKPDIYYDADTDAWIPIAEYDFINSHKGYTSTISYRDRSKIYSLFEGNIKNKRENWPQVTFGSWVSSDPFDIRYTALCCRALLGGRDLLKRDTLLNAMGDRLKRPIDIN